MIYACDACEYLFTSDKENVTDCPDCGKHQIYPATHEEIKEYDEREEKKPMNGIEEAVPLDKQEFPVCMEQIVKALKDAGYDPYTQLYGYVETGDDTYITRKGNARDKIGDLDRKLVWEFTMTLKKNAEIP